MFPFKPGGYFSCSRKPFGNWQRPDGYYRSCYKVISTDGMLVEAEDILSGEPARFRVDRTVRSGDEDAGLILRMERPRYESFCAISELKPEQALEQMNERARSLKARADGAMDEHNKYSDYVLSRTKLIPAREPAE